MCYHQGVAGPKWTSALVWRKVNTTHVNVPTDAPTGVLNAAICQVPENLWLLLTNQFIHGA